YNTDYPGSDIANFKATGDYNSMLGQCCDACKKLLDCSAYVLFEDVCYIKSASTEPVAKNGATATIVTTTTIPA
ncbi:hypothetical protein SDRG_12495, partial [Saprolegnia diclina VS20]